MIEKWIQYWSKSSGTTAKDIKNIQSQNNYTNILLQSTTSQLSRIENNSESKESKKENKKPINSIFIPIDETISKSDLRKLSTESSVIIELAKQRSKLSISNNTNVVDSIEELDNQFKEEIKSSQVNRLQGQNSKIPNFYQRPSFPDMQYDEGRKPLTTYNEDEVVEWNINETTQYQIIQIIENMATCHSTYLLHDINELTTFSNIIAGPSR